MSSSVEDRIVAMKFENRQFEVGVGSTITSLGRLKSAMDMTAAGGMASRGLGLVQSSLSKFGLRNPFATPQRGLQELQTSTSRFSMGTMEGGITSVSKSFLAMSTIAVTALSTITSQAIRSGGELAKSFTIDPITTGLKEYEDTLNSTQTLMSGTGESVESVTRTLQELNRYSDRTIYSFSDMTQNITAFTNAGMKTKPAAKVMMGIANAAASAGITAQQASQAMRGFGQSMSMGFVGLQDWNQVDNAQLATKEFKEELIKTAIEMGTLTKGMDGVVRTNKGTEVTFKNLRSTLQDQWLEADVLTGTLERYSDTSTKVGKKAAANATRVKTLSQAMGILKESAQSGWAQTWQNLFGNLEEATDLWTGFNDTIGGMIGDSAKARNAVLKDWKELGGRTDLINGIKDVWQGLMDVLSPIKKAFRDIFPAKTGQDLFELTQKFADFAEGLRLGEDTMDNIRRTFRGVFAIFDIAGQVIGGVVDMFQRLFGAMGAGSGKFLNFTGGVGDFLVAIDTMLRQSGFITAFFEGLGDILAIPMGLIAGLGDLLGRLFLGFDGGKAEKFAGAMDRVGKRLKPLETAGERVREIFGKIGDVFENVGGVIRDAMSGIGDAIADAFTGDNFDKSLDLINTGLLGAIVLMLKNFFSGELVSIDFGGGIFESLKGTLGAVTESLQNMQTNIKADILLKIAGALAILTASIVVLSLIDPKKLAKALTGMAVGFAGLQVAMTALASAVGYIGLAKLPIIASSLVILAGAMLLFSTSLLILSRIDTADMIKGLLGMTVMMRMMTKAVVPLSKNAAGMITAGVGLTAVAVALNIMAAALKSFAEMSWEEMGKGLAGAAGSLLVLASAMRVMPKDIAMQGAALLILSVALKVMASVVRDFSEMDYQTMGRGLAGVAGSLVILAGAMRLMPKNMIIQAVALTVVASALHILQGAVAKFGGMSMEAIGTGFIALGGSLLILAAGLTLMSGSLSGAAALVIVTAALAVLTPILITLGTLSIATIATALGTLAASFAVLGAAGYLLAPLVPVLIGLGAAIVLVGAGFALAGAGALAFATAFGIFVAAGAAGIAVLKGVLDVVIKSIPRFTTAFSKAILELLKTAVKAVPLIVQLFSDLMSGILDAIIKNAPKLAKAILVGLDAFLKVVSQATPKIAAAAVDLMLGLLKALDGKIPEIVTRAVNIITQFVDGLASNMGRLIQSGVNFVIKFMDGLSAGIRRNSDKIGESAADLAVAFIDGMVNGLAAGADRIKDAALDAAKAAWEEVKDFWKVFSPSRRMRELGQYVSEGFALGITDGEGGAVDAMDHMSTLIDEAAQAAAAEVERLQAKLKNLKDMKGDHSKEIKETERLLKAAKDERKFTEDAHTAWMKGSKEERDALKLKGKEYDALLVKIQEQQDELQRLIDLRQQEADSIANQYSGAPDLQNEKEERQLTPEEYAAELAAKAAATEQFAADLQRLRAMGMDDATYRKLLEEGLDAQPFVTQMIAGGADMVAAVGANQARLTAAAAALGNQAANDMHNAGIQAQQGIVDGLNNTDKVNLEAEMAKLAKKMIRALKKALKIKSPSREMAFIGEMADAGLAKGLNDYSKVAEKAAGGVGDKALDTIRVSMSKVGDTISGPINFQPTVTPVLDLTQLSKDATKISGLLDTGIITPTMSFDQVTALAAAAQAAKDAQAETSPVEVREVKFEQTNVSPRPLNPVEIYRNTKSGISLLKEALES